MLAKGRFRPSPLSKKYPTLKPWIPSRTIAVRAVASASVLLLGALSVGCAAGPNYLPPAPPKVNAFVAGGSARASAPAEAGVAAQTFEQGKTIPAEWWRLFASPQID